MIRTGIIGFGLSGEFFHTPFLKAHSEFDISAIASRQIDKVKSKLPLTNCYADAKALIASDDIDLIIITSPNDTHFDYAKEALSQGKHVVLEKPFVTQLSQGQVLIELAKKQQRLLSVFHNRRWDGDFLTLKKIIDEQLLGELKILESRFDRFRPTSTQHWRELEGEGTGILWDLGPHLIDQALYLFGEPLALTAHCESMRNNSQVTDYFHLRLHYHDKTILLHSSPFCAGDNFRYFAQGTLGSYQQWGLDPQENQLKAEKTPNQNQWGRYNQNDFGKLNQPENTQIINTEPGNYMAFFQQLADAILRRQPLPVTAEEALKTIYAIQLAEQSHQKNRTIDWDFNHAIG